MCLRQFWSELPNERFARNPEIKPVNDGSSSVTIPVEPSKVTRIRLNSGSGPPRRTVGPPLLATI